MRIQVITPPIDEPLELDMIRDHLRAPEVDWNDDELLRFAATARQWAEHRTALYVMTQTLDVFIDAFPDSWSSYTKSRLLYGSAYVQNSTQIPMPRPLASVEYVKYIDSAGALITIDPADYIVITGEQRPHVDVAVGKTWPCSRGTTDSVVIRCVAGWTDLEFVPPNLVSYMLNAVAWLTENRSLATDRQSYENALAPHLLDPFRVLGV